MMQGSATEMLISAKDIMFIVTCDPMHLSCPIFSDVEQTQKTSEKAHQIIFQPYGLDNEIYDSIYDMIQSRLLLQ